MVIADVRVKIEKTYPPFVASFGVGGGSWIGDRWYVLGTVNDANGTLTEEFDFFEGGAEFFSQAEVGWSPSKDERYLKNGNLTFWHVDERDDAGIEGAEGVLFSANWTFNETWMPFFRAGWSDGSAPIYNRSLTLGAIRKFAFRSDLSGLGVNWGDPPDDSLDEQITVEAFHRFQIAQNLAVTTSLQFLVDTRTMTKSGSSVCAHESRTDGTMRLRRGCLTGRLDVC